MTITRATRGARQRHLVEGHVPDAMGLERGLVELSMLFVIHPILFIAVNVIRPTTRTHILTSHAASALGKVLLSKFIYCQGRIIPCKSVDMGLRQYDDYPGYVSYTFSGSKLTFPSVEYSYYRQNGDNVEAGQMKMQGITLDVALNGNIMSLSGTAEHTDNLGNVKKRTNVKVEITKG